MTQVKEDNKEIATMERQAAETQDHISRLQEELSQLDRYTRLSSKAFVAIKIDLSIRWLKIVMMFH